MTSSSCPGVSEELFRQVEAEIATSLAPIFKAEPEQQDVFANLSVPEFVHTWKAVWLDDFGRTQVNTCWRVQQNSALGPYKGGLRFDSSVTLDVLRSLALEQTLKNALTGKDIGGAKGGSDFNPKNRSDRELRRFCDAFMLGLHKVIGPEIDVPAGDIGVNSKTIGFLYGSYRKFGHGHEGALSGKPRLLGGSELRTEATGYGVVYLLLELLKDMNIKKGYQGGTSVSDAELLRGKRVLVSGAGNVATYCAKKCVFLGAKLLTLSDRSGTYWCDEGMTDKTIDDILAYKESPKKNNLPKNVTLVEGKAPWQVILDKNADIDIALPCATQNEIDKRDAEALLARGCSVLVEGSNISSTASAVDLYKSSEDQKKLEYVGSKLANLGGVATSYLEMMQNGQKDHWPVEKVDEQLRGVMQQAYKLAKEAAAQYNCTLTDGANIAAFKKVSNAMVQMGYANL